LLTGLLLAVRAGAQQYDPHTITLDLLRISIRRRLTLCDLA